MGTLIGVSARAGFLDKDGQLPQIERPMLVDAITTPSQRAAVAAYKTEVSRKSDLERTELARDKTGVFTGAFAVNPFNH